MLDSWLRQLAVESGIEVLHKAEFVNLNRESRPLQVLIRYKGKIVRVTTRYLIGADGIYSCVRRQLYEKIKVNIRLILQDYWRAKFDFGDYFYVFFRSELTPTYSYVIPKNDLYIVGAGIPRRDRNILKYINWLNKWLREEFGFRPRRLIKREIWAIPCGFSLEGFGNAVLIGDAGGFCNVLTGEGIGLAVKSGVAASRAVQDAISCGKPLALAYRNKIEHVSRFVHKAWKFTLNLTDKDFEQFVKFELNREH